MIVLDATSFVFLVFPLVLHEVFGEWHLDAGGTSRIFLGLGRFLRIRALLRICPNVVKYVLICTTL